MPRSSRHKHELAPISIDEALSDSALTGMLSFLERKPTGVPLPWVAETRDTTVENPPTVEEASTVTFITTAEDLATVKRVLQPIQSGAVKEDSTIEEAATVEEPSTVAALPVSFTKPVKARLMLATLVQHGHTAAEQILYTTLWTNGKPDAKIPETRLTRLGYSDLTRLCGFSKRTLTTLIAGLIEKLAIEVAESGDYNHTSRRYRVWDMKALLERRRSAGMNWVIRNKGVRFVDGPKPEDPSTVTSLSTGEEKNKGRSCYRSVEEPALVTVEDPSTQLRIRRSLIKNPSTQLVTRGYTPTMSPEAEQLGQGIRELGLDVDDDELPQDLLDRCRQRAGDCSLEEILYFVQKKILIIKMGNIQNAAGFLLTTVPKCFTGTAFAEFRRNQQKQGQGTAIGISREECLVILEDPNASGQEHEMARELLERVYGAE